ncbi:hypothetical protein LXT21_42350 [Myxococcus sp. K38C18041901]|uniref:hypothetical protein n=1 Tax=Myxococcus guangdongensis TaxID=2906760 RepID=UPI0020A73CF9|nr:hypothetical protein [Myxococcus guangdongensis]MCP3065426.1 hypothetical protein [Myxococcus guangdongensis]
MIPTKPSKKREEASPDAEKRKLINFVPDPDVDDFLSAMKEQGVPMRKTIQDAIRICRDAAERMGREAWFEVEKQAKVRGVSIGAILAELAGPALGAAIKESGPSASKKGGKG